MALKTTREWPTTTNAPSVRLGSGREPLWRVWGWAGALAITLMGCGMGDEAPLPRDVEDPATLQTPAGAMARYHEVVREFGSAFDGAMAVGGTMSDELMALPLPLGVGGPFTALDSREDVSTERRTAISNSQAIRLQRLRGQAREGRGFVDAYAPDSSPALGAHLYAIEGYAELFLADLFCSGIPLSTVDFAADYTLAAGSTTNEVYQHAAALFDSALARAGDSVRFLHLAAVGRGRALTAIGRYAEAAAAVAAVPNDYRFETRFFWSHGDVLSDEGVLLWFAKQASESAGLLGALTMGDQEGGVGYPYRSSGDPRTAPWTVILQDPSGERLYFPKKYTTNGLGTDLPAENTGLLYLVASGLEARLIEAEAALQAGSPAWLTTLNALRTSGTFDTQPNVADPTVNDTLWHAGIGGVAGLRPLDDPGEMTARVDLVFRERAFWLYLTAHRQGDLRRLIRAYLRDPNTVYPTGMYVGGPGAYGRNIILDWPTGERRLNPKYTGCFHRNA